MSYKRLWIPLTVVIVASFTVLGVAGYRGIQKAPPIPGRVVGALILGWFVVGLLTGHSYSEEGYVTPGQAGVELRSAGD